MIQLFSRGWCVQCTLKKTLLHVNKCRYTVTVCNNMYVTGNFYLNLLDSEKLPKDMNFFTGL